MPYGNLNSDVDKCAVGSLFKGDFSVLEDCTDWNQSLSLVYFTLLAVDIDALISYLDKQSLR